MYGIGLFNVNYKTVKYLGNVDIKIKKRVYRNSIVTGKEQEWETQLM